MPGELVGRTAAEQRVSRQLRAVRFETRAELIEFCFALMGLAARYAPVETGDLRGSFVLQINGETWMHTTSSADGSVTVVRDRTDVPEEISRIEVYVGTAGIVYALRQHEELTWQHPRGGGPKYLERAYDELSGMLGRRMQDAKERGLRKG